MATQREEMATNDSFRNANVMDWGTRPYPPEEERSVWRNTGYDKFGFWMKAGCVHQLNLRSSEVISIWCHLEWEYHLCFHKWLQFIKTQCDLHFMLLPEILDLHRTGNKDNDKACLSDMNTPSIWKTNIQQAGKREIQAASERGVVKDRIQRYPATCAAHPNTPSIHLVNTLRQYTCATQYTLSIHLVPGTDRWS